MSGPLRLFWFRPGKPGQGGYSAGYHTFMGLEDTRIVEGLRPYRLRWMKDQESAVLYDNVATPGARKPLAICDWHYFSAGALSPTNLPLWIDSYADLGTCYSGLRKLTDGTAIFWDSRMGTDFFPAALCPVNDRIFAATGFGRARVYDGTNVFKAGVVAPWIAPTVVVDFNFTAGQYYYAGAGGTTVQWKSTATDANYDGLLPGETVRLTHETLSNPNYVERKVVERVSGTTVSGAPHSGPFAFCTKRAVPPKVTNAAGTPTWVVDAGFPTDGTDIATAFLGLTMKVSTVDYVITNAVNNGDDTTTLTTATNGPGVTAVGFSLSGVRVYLDGAVPGDSTSESADRKLSRPAPGADYSSWKGAEAPGYAYAYYDHVSGHISNLSPVTYLSSTDVVNGRIRLDITQNNTTTCANGDTPVSGVQTATGIQYAGEWGSEEVARYTKILFFRTKRVGGGAMFYPIGSLDPGSSKWMGRTGAPGSASGYWTDTSTDADLIVSGRISPPLTTNHPPRIVGPTGTASHITPFGMAFWQGRLWLFGPPDMSALHYSCDNAQAGMGRPEECFPDGNRLVIPASDGALTSILVVGPYLLVNTHRYSYVVRGNNETNYVLELCSTELAGVGADAICAIPSESGGGATIAAATSDKRFLLLDLFGKGEDIGQPILPYLGGQARGITFYRQGGHARIAACLDPSASPSSTAGHVFEFNLKHGIWTYNPPVRAGEGISPATVQRLTSFNRSKSGTWPNTSQAEPFLVWAQAGDILGEIVTQTTGRAGGTISTWTFPTEPGKKRYAFMWARVVLIGTQVGSVNPPWLYVSVNELAASAFQYHLQDPPDATRKLFGATTGLDGTVRELVCFGPSWTVGPVSPADGRLPTGFRFDVSLSLDQFDAVRYELPFLEVALMDVTEEGVQEP